MKNRKRNRRIGISLLIITIITILYLKSFSNTEIAILNHLTKENDSMLVQVCLVSNPPSSSSELIEKIKEFNAKHKVKGKYFKRLFIKEHENDFINYINQEDINYKSNNTKLYDIDNIDFLATSSFYVFKNGKIINETKCYIGEIWYLKK